MELATKKINEVFKRREYQPNNDTDDGFIGDEVGVCPLCGGKIRRTNFGYGCSAYREKGCKFSVSGVICSRVIPKSAVERLLSEGKTQKLDGFVSPRTGKTFSAALKLDGGKAVFDF